MYLNILEYIEKDEQETYLGMIKMSEEYEGVITKIRNEGKAKWFDEGKRANMCDVISRLLDTFSIDEIARLLDMDRDEVTSFLNSN